MNIKKSPEDNREYRYIELPNGIKSVLINDPETDKSSACLRVAVGSFTDPRDLPGLAHFLEHMLFLGTETYPEEDFFEDFLQQNGGSINANTWNEETNYFFDIHNSALLEALPRLASLFICPLLRSNSVEREVNAIQSEFELNFQSDGWRFTQLLGHLSEPGSVLNRFQIGNKKTLLDDPKTQGREAYKELKSFFNQYYSSEIMSLCVIAREPLDVIEKHVRLHFTKIPRKPKQNLDYPLFPQPIEYYRKIVRFESVKDKQNLNLQWVMPPIHEDYQSKPNFLVSNLIGYEGKGSLFSSLRDEGLVSSLSCGSFDENKGMYSFNIKIKLVIGKSVENLIKKVVKKVFQYVNMMEKMTDMEWKLFYDDISLVERQNFIYQSKIQPINYSQMIAKDISLFPPDEIISGPYLITEFNPAKIRKFVRNLKSTEHFCVYYNSKTALNNINDSEISIEPYFQVRHSTENMSTEFINSLETSVNNEFLPPSRNLYITKDISLRTENKNQQEYPEKIKSSELYEVYFLPDSRYKKPHGFIALFLYTTASYSTPQISNMADIFLKYFDLIVKEDIYDAEIAGISCNLFSTKEGFSIEVNGFNEMIPLLFEKIMKSLIISQVDENLFKIAKDSVIKKLKSFRVVSSHVRSIYNKTWISEDLHWHNDLKTNLIEHIDIEQFRDYCENLFKESYFKMYIAGNFNNNDVNAICKKLQTFSENKKVSPLYSAEKLLLLRRSMRTPKQKGKALIHLEESTNPDEPNSSLLLSFQLDMATDHNYCMTKLLKQITSEELYTRLRTQQNLGYYVTAYFVKTNNVCGFNVLVQGEYSPVYVYGRIVNALREIYNSMEDCSEEKFSKYRTALINKILKKDINLKEEADRFWEEIKNGFCNFRRKDKQALIVETITKEQFLNFFKENILDNNNTRAVGCGVYAKNKMLVNKDGKDEEINLDRFDIIGDVEMFKRKCKLLPSTFIE